MTNNNSSLLQLLHYSSDFDDEEEQDKPQILNLEFEIQQLDRHLKLLENSKEKLTRCEICKTDLKSYMHAKTHYISIRHKKTFTEVRDNGVKEILKKAQNIKPSNCKVCDEIVPGNILSLENHLNSEEHKKNLESYCLVCDFMAESAEALIEHENTTLEHWNKSYGNGNEEFSPKVLPTKTVEVNHTLINNESGLSLSEDIHINRSEHKEGKTNKAIENNNIPIQNIKVESEVSTEEIKETIFEDASIKKSKKEVKDSPTSNNIITNQTKNDTDRLYCYLCKMKFLSKILHNVHCFSFPHFEVSKWKSEAVSLGVPYAEYWIHSKNSIMCTLCDIEILTPASFRTHNEKSDHRTHLSEWCQAFATWKLDNLIDPKYFYCPLCNVFLLGTTEAEDHYINSQQHLELRADQNLLEHKMSLKPRNNKCFNTLYNNMDPETPERFYKPSSSTEEANNSDARLFEEIEKLMDTLYYSKTVPSDVALKYLKKINSEMTELKHKHDKYQEPPVRTIFSEKEGTREYKLESFMSKNHTGDGLLRVTIDEK